MQVDAHHLHILVSSSCAPQRSTIAAMPPRGENTFVAKPSRLKRGCANAHLKPIVLQRVAAGRVKGKDSVHIRSLPCFMAPAGQRRIVRQRVSRARVQ